LLHNRRLVRGRRRRVCHGRPRRVHRRAHPRASRGWAGAPRARARGAASPRRAGFPRLVGPTEWDCFQATAATIALARLER